MAISWICWVLWLYVRGKEDFGYKNFGSKCKFGLQVFYWRTITTWPTIITVRAATIAFPKKKKNINKKEIPLSRFWSRFFQGLTHFIWICGTIQVLPLKTELLLEKSLSLAPFHTPNCIIFWFLGYYSGDKEKWCEYFFHHCSLFNFMQPFIFFLVVFEKKTSWICSIFSVRFVIFLGMKMEKLPTLSLELTTPCCWKPFVSLTKALFGNHLVFYFLF